MYIKYKVSHIHYAGDSCVVFVSAVQREGKGKLLYILV